MHNYQHIEVNFENEVFCITLNRPHKRNAIGEQTMDELLHAIEQVAGMGRVVAAIINAHGNDFSAGADLEWMRTTQQMTEDQLQQQNMKLQKVFAHWFDLPVFTIAQVHGNVVGGAIGLMAASDLVIAEPSARFRFSEVSLGLIPATIAPFVLQRTSSRYIRNAMLTALPFSSEEAHHERLVDVVAEHALQAQLIEEYTAALRRNEPGAIARCKQLTNDLVLNRIAQPLDVYTTRLLAQVRKSEAASARIAEFFNKR